MDSNLTTADFLALENRGYGHGYGYGYGRGAATTGIGLAAGLGGGLFCLLSQASGA